jgi:hypothetical protein
MRYVVRQGQERGDNCGWYLARSGLGMRLHAGDADDATPCRSDAVVFDDRAHAAAVAKSWGGRVVRRVSRAEAVAKARAEGRADGLREAAVLCGCAASTFDITGDTIAARALRLTAKELEQMAADGVGR